MKLDRAANEVKSRDGRRIAKVLTAIPRGEGVFDYAVPESLRDRAALGSLVAVPLGGDYIQGMIIGFAASSEIDRLKEVLFLIDEAPIVTAAQLKLGFALAKWTLSPLSACMNVVMPEKIRRLSEAFLEIPPEILDAEPLQGRVFEDSLDPSAPIGDRVFCRLAELQRATGAAVPEKALTAEFPFEAELGKVIGRLIRSGKVARRLALKRPRDKKRTVKGVRLTEAGRAFAGERKGRLAKSEPAQTRRCEIVTWLLNQDSPARAAEAIHACGGSTADLTALCKLGLAEIVELDVAREYTETLPEKYPAPSDIRLTEDQAAAVAAISYRLRGGDGDGAALIQGVTGSGKTEVYLRAAGEAIALGKQVLVLVPEIALTPQLAARFRARFPGQVAVYHSKLSEGQRFDAWNAGRSGRARVIVGTRSAFAVPLPDLGLILMDECHDDSYYQSESAPYFSAGPLAVAYGKIAGAAVVFGSATPTVAQRYKAERSGWTFLRMTARPGLATVPEATVVDLREELKDGNRSLFSRELVGAVNRTLSAGRQSILFMNRRGSFSYTFCAACGEAFKCPKCDLNLTLHQSTGRLECHFCGYKAAVPDVCPHCGSTEINRFSAGIEQVELLAKETFPQARILRMDSDMTGRKGAVEEILSRFMNREADMLIGTRMVSKGLDLPDVALVGVVLAEIGGGLLDYRVDEQIYQLMTQVIGRAGRGKTPGRAVLQTYQPERYSLAAAVAGDADAFYTQELAYRRRLGYPPFSRMARVLIISGSPERAQSRCLRVAAELRNVIAQRGGEIRLIGPTPCFYQKLNDRYRWQVVLRGARIADTLRGFNFGDARFEMDPVSLL